MAEPNVIAPPEIAPAAVGVPLGGVDYLLDVVGFHNPAERLRIIEAGLTNYEDFHYLIDKDIRDMAEEFAKRSAAQGRITFRLGRIKKLTGLMHWVQDCFRTDNNPNDMIFNEEALAEAQSCTLICKSDIDLVDTNTKAANPGKFGDERKWPEWNKAFTNYLSVIPGGSGIPLSYVICDNNGEPDEDEMYLSFNERMITRAPHTGQYYEADSHRVHNLLTGFLHGEPTETWIHSLFHFQDGRRDMLALRHHYAGEGNSTRWIADA
jgi:hypothetical protein